MSHISALLKCIPSAYPHIQTAAAVVGLGTAVWGVAQYVSESGDRANARNAQVLSVWLDCVKIQEFYLDQENREVHFEFFTFVDHGGIKAVCSRIQTDLFLIGESAKIEVNRPLTAKEAMEELRRAVPQNGAPDF